MSVRIDKWLWAVRVFKTRSDAAEACKSNRIIISDSPVKPSREVKIGDIITVRKPPINYIYKVLQTVENRRPAKEVPLFMEDLTPQEQIDELKVQRTTIFVQRDRGTGRPTKKDRRDMDKFVDDFTEDE